MNAGGPLCDTTNILKSPATLQKSSRGVSKTYKRASSTSKRTVAALATTLEKVAELENIHAKASITPTRQKRKRDNLRALDTDNEVKMLQEYFRDVDQCVLEEDVRTSVTPRKDFCAATRAPWLTPEEKPRGKVRPREWVTPDAARRTQPHQDMFSTPEPKRTQHESLGKETQLANHPEKEIFATPEPKLRAGRKPRANTAQEHAQETTPVKTQAQTQRTYGAGAGKLRRVR